MIHETKLLTYWRAVNAQAEAHITLDRAAYLLAMNYSVDDAAFLADDLEDALGAAQVAVRAELAKMLRKPIHYCV